jgi:hypothetical protein
MNFFCEAQQNFYSQVKMNAAISFTINGDRVKMIGDDMTLSETLFKELYSLRNGFLQSS